MLGKVCGHLARASELILGQSGARAGASRGRVWPIPPVDQKIRGVYPRLTIALFLYYMKLDMWESIHRSRGEGQGV